MFSGRVFLLAAWCNHIRVLWGGAGNKNSLHLSYHCSDSAHSISKFSIAEISVPTKLLKILQGFGLAGFVKCRFCTLGQGAVSGLCL